MAPSHLGDQQFRRPSFIEIIQTPGQFHHAQGAIRGTVELKPNRRYQRGPILGDDIQFNVRSGDELTLRGSPNRVSPAQFTQKFFQCGPVLLIDILGGYPLKSPGRLQGQ